MTDYIVAEVQGPEQLRLAERRLGELGPTDVVARVHAAGICGTDVGIYEGTLPYFRTGLMRFPVVPGHEWSGVVVAVGAAVTRVKPGDRITSECHIGCGACRLCRLGRYNLCPARARVGLVGIEGAFAEHIVVPEKAVHRLPPELDLETAALIEPATVAFRAVEKLGPLGGKRAMVLGAGPIGLLAALFLRAGGAGWLAVADLERSRLNLASTLGVDLALDPADADVEAAVRKATDGDGADVVIEATGRSEPSVPDNGYAAPPSAADTHRCKPSSSRVAGVDASGRCAKWRALRTARRTSIVADHLLKGFSRQSTAMPTLRWSGGRDGLGRVHPSTSGGARAARA